jgi:acetyl-CoA acetyltransferase
MVTGTPDAYVVGVGALPVGNYSHLLEHEMIVGAFLAAVADAGVTKEQIDALIFSHPRIYADQRYFATFIAGYLELPVGDVLMEVLGNGMTGALAFDTAVERVKTGQAQVAVALGVSRELHIPTPRHMEFTMRTVGDVDFHAPFGVTPIAWYAMNATRYLAEFNVSHETLATVAVKNRRHASLNPIAQYRKEITVEDVLNARPIVRPLSLLDVPPRSDGAAAIIVASPAVAQALGRDQVGVVARGFHHEGVHQVAAVPESLVEFESAKIASAKALDAAGITSQAIDLAEVYAPCSIIEVILSESIGLFPRGEGAHAAAAGETSLGGRIPIATSGGCGSRGHPPMATPLYQVVELVEQLRGDAGARQVVGAEVGITASELGDYNSTLVHVLRRF